MNGSAARHRRAVTLVLDNLVWLILAVILALFSILIPGYFQLSIFTNIAYHATFVGILAVGMSFCIIAGHMDLSVESTMAFSALLVAWLAGDSQQASGWQIGGALALAVALALGAVIATVNGLLVVGARINAFIATLGMYIGVRGLGLALTEGRSIFNLPPMFGFVATTSIGGIPVLVMILVAVYGLFHFVLGRTLFGRRVYLIGGNVTAAYRAGIAVDRTLYLVFILAGVLAGFAGWLMAARTNGATPNIGTGYLFDVFAAVVIGGVSLQGGVGRLSGVFAGVLLLGSISTAINILGIGPYYLQVIRGGLVLLAVLLDSLRRIVRPNYV
jgi:ribose transport system permease protein